MLDLEQSSSGSELVERQLKDALDKLSQAEQLASEKEKASFNFFGILNVTVCLACEET